MNTFTAIDFQTAQLKKWSVCQFGLIRVENGQITHEFNQLICPPKNFYFYWNSQIHGISAETTSESPTFPEVWQKIKPFIQDQLVVSFFGDFNYDCLKHSLAYYRLEEAQCQFKSIELLYDSDIVTLCTTYGIFFSRYNSLSVATVCVGLYCSFFGK